MRAKNPDPFGSNHVSHDVQPLPRSGRSLRWRVAHDQLRPLWLISYVSFSWIAYLAEREARAGAHTLM